MDWKNQLTKTPYLVLFIVLISIGVGTASALITITLSGDVIITGFLDMTGDKIANVDTPTLPTDAATKAYVDSAPGTDTLTLLGCTDGEIPMLVGNEWTCLTLTIYTDQQAITAVGPHTVDTDTLALLGCTDTQIAQFVGNGWTCVADPAIATDVNCVGCVSATDLATGSVTSDEIADDTITTSDILDDTITTSDILDNTITGEDIADGTTIKAITQNPRSNLLSVPDATGSVGRDTSITIGTDGLPIISYYDNGNGDLKVAKCGSNICIPNWIRR